MTLCLFCSFSAHLPEGWGGTGAGALFLCIIVVSTWLPSKGLRPLGMGPPHLSSPRNGGLGREWLFSLLALGNLPAHSRLVFCQLKLPYLERS